MPTNKELEAQMLEMQKRNDELNDRVIAMEESRPLARQHEAGMDFTSFRDAPEGGGWVIRTPNKVFNGETCGTRFVQGMAVIAKSVDDAENKVMLLMSEYGYSAQPVSEADMNSFNQYVTTNLASLMDGKSGDMEAKYSGIQPIFDGVVKGG